MSEVQEVFDTSCTMLLNPGAVRPLYMEFWFFVVLSSLYLVTVMCYDSVHGERYIGPVVMVINLVGQKQCIQKCLERSSVCKGVNYSRQNLLCELVTTTEMTEQRSGYVRVGLSQVSKLSGSYFCNSNCKFSFL